MRRGAAGGVRSLKVCFIGNSHLAAFKTGWDQRGNLFPGVDADFFGSAGAGFARLTREGRNLVSHDQAITRQIEFTSGGKSQITLDDYDAFILVAMGHGMIKHLKNCADHRPIGMAPASYIISDKLFAKSIYHNTRRSVAAKIAKLIREVTDSLIIMCEQPLPRPMVKENGLTLWKEIHAVAPEVARVFNKVKTRMEGSLSLVSIRQPESTIADSFFTKTEFGENAIRLRPGFDKTYQDDVEHMNAAFGLEYLRSIKMLSR